MFDLSPWLQTPLILLVVLPLAGVASWAMLRVSDWIAYKISKK